MRGLRGRVEGYAIRTIEFFRMKVQSIIRATQRVFYKPCSRGMKGAAVGGYFLYMFMCKCILSVDTSASDGEGLRRDLLARFEFSRYSSDVPYPFVSGRNGTPTATTSKFQIAMISKGGIRVGRWNPWRVQMTLNRCANSGTVATICFWFGRVEEKFSSRVRVSRWARLNVPQLKGGGFVYDIEFLRVTASAFVFENVARICFEGVCSSTREDFCAVFWYRIRDDLRRNDGETLADIYSTFWRN